MVKRDEILNQLKELLAYFPAVGLIGPRQVGKTTLAKTFAPNALYLDLESARDRAKLADPYLFLNNYKDQLVVLDEIQYLPELFNELRGLIDEYRVSGRFLILGSASPGMIRQSAESLAGRIGYIELPPLILQETGLESQNTLWLRGGFPDSFTAKLEKQSIGWRKHFVRTYIERDLPQLGLKADPILLEKMWRMLASFQGNIWNAENFSRSLGITAKTVNSYLNFMESAFMLHRLPPYSVNVKKRLVKSPKIYLRDSGILHYLSDIQTFQELQFSLLIGASWEGFVVEQIMRVVGDKYKYYYYRTHQGTECDLLLVRAGKVEVAIEVKYSTAPTLTKGLKLALEDLQPMSTYIIIPEGGSYPIADRITVASLATFLSEVLQDC